MPDSSLELERYALAAAAVLVTNNEAEFARVLGVRVENWAS